ncbi:MAG: AtpZ/AtpI family protein [Tissierellia bacterium]|nr:AtpZ/AtpI family protein [Tissierellia bacterium]
MASSVFVGVMLGKYLDGFLGTSPWLLLIFSLLGVGAAIRVLFNISKDQKDEK